MGENGADMAMNKCTHGKEDALETGTDARGVRAAHADAT